MRIEHVAFWVNDLGAMKVFYETFFGGKANAKYVNEKRGFSSYFIAFESGARLELMHLPSIEARQVDEEQGYAHIAFVVGDQRAVDVLTERFRGEGYAIVGEPRVTGDGYYESVILDPESNRIELTAE